MDAIDPPSHLSAEAREFLVNYRVVGAALDLEDSEAVDGGSPGIARRMGRSQ